MDVDLAVMNIVFITNDPSDGDNLKQELENQATAIHIVASLNTQDALANLSTSAPCDAVLLDASVSNTDAVNLVSAIRSEKKSLGIVALVGTAEGNPPTDLIKAGVDKLVLKRAGFVSPLAEALIKAADRHRSNSVYHARQTRLLYAGDAETIRQNLSSLTYLTVEPVTFAPDGFLRLPEITSFQNEILVIDFAASGANTLKAIKDVHLRVPEVAIILLTEPGDEEIAIQALNMGATDCLAKTDSCFMRLLPAIEREIKHRELIRESTAIKTREERLRQIVETMPVGVTVIAPDGSILAINHVGLKLIGANRLEQVIGKSILQLLPPEEREKILTFLATIDKGAATSVFSEWTGLDGTISGIQLRAVPMRRDPDGTIVALAVMSTPSDSQNGEFFESEADKKLEENIAIPKSETRREESQDEDNSHQSMWEAAYRRAESDRATAEEQLARLRASAEEAKTRYKTLLEEQRAERENWEKARRAFEEQYAKIESEAQFLRSSQESLLETHSADRAQWESKLQELEQKQLSVEANLAQASDEFDNERSQWNSARLELEQKFQTAEELRSWLETDLRKADSRLAQQAKAHAAERDQWDITRLELEKKYRAIENHRSGFETALREADSIIAQLIENNNVERSQWDAARLALEQKYQEAEEHRSRLETELREADAKLSQQAETYAAERSQRNADRLALEQKYQEAEEHRSRLETELREADSNLAQQAETYAAEHSQRDAARLELEQKYQEAEEHRSRLETELREADSRLAQQADTYAAEHSQRDAARLELEQKYQEAEEHRSRLETELRAVDAKLAQQAEAYAAERSQWDAARLELEQRYQEAEKRQSEPEAALQEAESRLAQQAEAYAAERSQWDADRLELERKYQAVEDQRSAFETALHEADSVIAQLIEGNNAQRTQWDADRLELEQKHQEAERQRSELEAALQQAELRLTQEAEAHNSARSQWDAARLELEKKFQAAEEQRFRLETDLREADSKIAQLIENHNAERSQWDITRLELEKKNQAAEDQRSTLDSALRDLDSKLVKLIENHNAERAQWDAARLEFEQKYRTADDQRSTLEVALNEANSKLAQLIENHNAERAQWDAARLEFEQKYQAAEGQRSTLNSALRDLDSKLVKLIENHNAERAQWDAVRLELEQKNQSAEDQLSKLEATLNEADSKIARLIESQDAERSGWHLTQQELERKCQAAEEQHTAEMEAAVREAESRLGGILSENRAKSEHLEEIRQQVEQLKTDMERLKAELKDANIRHEKLSQATSVGVILATREGRVLECNEAAARMFGYVGAEEALSQSEEDAFRIYSFEGVLDTRLQREGSLTEIEWSTLGRDGRLIRFQEDAKLKYAPGRESPLVERILTDITKVHRLSEEIRRTRRMESTGDLAAATVRSLKSLCTSCAHWAKLLMEKPDDSDAVRRVAETLAKNANRGIRHTRQFLAVALKSDRAPELVSLNEILETNNSLLRSLAGEDIDLQMVLSPHLGLVTGDRQEMIQLISNLVASSREALPLGGAVTVETVNVDIDTSTASYPADMQSGTYVQMTITADGCVVQPERRTASNRMIVERMGGWLETTNNAESGNIHQIYLPRVEAFAGRVKS
jgi:PAS domain S-box-containing protein